MPGRQSGRIVASEARSPSGKAKVCKTFIGGSIPPRASKSAASKSVLSERRPGAGSSPQQYLLTNLYEWL
jgi:hypothetical protein